MANENVVVSTEPVIIGKLSIGSLKLKGAVAIGKKSPVGLCAIYGSCSGFKAVENKQTGEIHEALTGEFEATILFGDDNGKRFRSGVLYLPKGLHEQMLGAAKKLMTDGDSIDFGVKINAVEATNAAGYTYEGEVLYKPASAPDPLELLRAKLPGLPALTAAPALAAPAKDEKPAPAKK